ncbi:uroporphyrinogen-III synthase [Limibaculum sp. FT325]|uniref:uroporphyrinogen-III synthase n=1 Tax=Thermohalobaculum sediminis TaxID=2939436 RepID=UPI0020C09CF2|nr:uroporphyrinogen-III synthase [Limibaculum sediminis]MCL5777258.1 uroporphyrinogen-III synthase [Limibaculum sediminis]
MVDPVVLVTRPEAEAARVVARLAALGIAALAWPLTAIRFLPGPVAIPDGTGALLFTSANGVAAFARASARRDLPALCVGERTAEAARQAGFTDAESADGDVRSLARLAACHGARAMLHPRGEDAAGDLAGHLARHGIAVAEAILYAAEETGAVPPPICQALESGRPCVVTAWSPRNAAILARRFAANPAWRRENLHAAAISDRAAGPLRDGGLGAVTVAARPDGDAMLDAIVAAWHAAGDVQARDGDNRS